MTEESNPVTNPSQDRDDQRQPLNPQRGGLPSQGGMIQNESVAGSPLPTFDASSYVGPETTMEERVDQLYEDVGGCGLFQVFAYFAIAFGMSGPSWFIYEVGFLTQAPNEDEYLCRYQGGDPFSCTKQQICDGDDTITTWEADPEGEKFLYNWQQQLDLTCVDDWKVGMIGASLFIGWCVTLLWVPNIADKQGRRKLFWLGMVLDLLLYIGLLITSDLTVMIIIWFCFGMCCSIRIQVGYIYLMEMLPKKMQVAVTSGWNIQEAAIYVVATVYFWKISLHWFWYVLVGFFWQFISVVLLVWMPESPRYLLSVGKLDEARKAFENIAWWNKVRVDWGQNKMHEVVGKKAPKFISPVMCSQDSETLQDIVELGGLPLTMTESTVRQWLQQQLGEELMDEVSSLGLTTDNFMNNLMASRNTGLASSAKNIRFTAMSSDALSTVCFIGFSSEESLDQACLILEQAKFEGKPLRVKKSIMSASEIVVAKSQSQIGVNHQSAEEEDVEEVVPTTSFYLKQPKIMTNLVLMSIVWLSTSFGYYLILTLVNTFDKVYISAFSSSFSEMAAYVISGIFYQKVGVKLSLTLAFAISAVGGILILTWGLNHESSPWFFVCFLLTKFGVTCTFNINFVANQYFFPTLFAATALGVCNFLARLASSFSFIVSEMDEPLPMILFTVLCTIAALASAFLNTEKKK